MAADVGEDGAGAFLRAPLDDGEVEFLGGAFGKLCGEGLMGIVVFGDNEAAGCIFIKPVDDSGAFDATDAR